MRRISFVAAATALSAVAIFGTSPSASAATAGTCSDNYAGIASGYMAAYDGVNCDGTVLGSASDNDLNWNDSSGKFQTDDAYKASSILNKGNYSEVQFFPGAFGTFDYNHQICLLRSEGYASDLRDDYWFEDPRFGTVNNSIGSHRWVSRDACAAFAV
ncbi:hypothetical protein KV205_26560 [Streptomyces sp. SKN60]|uniref:hypothetical protein n=1 Tax=Streptomyces sp. SKN60 TaxID=2855506 RepID=UPI0022482651|nr:hypothetical protein [Streptomyces sp. SKN60]MCX2184069.1 hypothetical protein [Streptomyces sp. SKN60]